MAWRGGGRGFNGLYCSGSGCGQVADCCEYSNEPAGYIKFWGFLD